MNRNASKTARKTVRMFDGTEWAEYKVGSKKHRAAEARRAEWEATRVTGQAFNKFLADDLRAHGVTPSGSAWKMAKEAEDLDVLGYKALKAANKDDGIAPPSEAQVAAAKKRQAERKAATKDGLTPVEAQARVDALTKAEAEAKRAERKDSRKGKKGGKGKKAPKLTAAEIARAKRVEAGRKGWETRVANGTAVKDPVTGRFVAVKTEAPAPTVDEAEVVRKQGKKALFWADLSDAGLSDAEIKAAWKIRKASMA